MRRQRTLPLLLFLVAVMLGAGILLFQSQETRMTVPPQPDTPTSSDTGSSDPLQVLDDRPAPPAPDTPTEPDSEAIDAPPTDESNAEPNKVWTWEDEIPHRYTEPRDTSRFVHLAGHVVDIAGGPIGGAHVAVTAAQSLDKYRTAGGLKTLGKTNEEGAFAGDYGLNTTSIVFELSISAQLGGLESPPVKLTVTPGDSYENILIQMPSSGSLSGRVVDSTFQPLELALVTVKAVSVRDLERGNLTSIMGPKALSDAEGRFQVTGLGSGNYVLTVSLAGYSLARVEATLADGGRQELADIVLATSTSVRMKLVCEARQPEGKFRATFHSNDGSTATRTVHADARGMALIDDVPGWAIELVIEMPGFSRKGVSVSPIAGVHEDIGTIVLELAD